VAGPRAGGCEWLSVAAKERFERAADRCGVAKLSGAAETGLPGARVPAL